jgi:hypothetical protein
MCPTLAEHQLAKILICGQQQGTPVVGLAQNLLVGDAGCQLGDPNDGVAILAESLYGGSVHALIGNQVHADFLPTG